MDKAAAAAIGAKFGESIKDYTKASENIIEAILLDHCNEGIKLMSKHIKSKARTGQASTLAASMDNKLIQVSATKFEVKTVTSVDYADYVDKGVQKSPKLRGGKSNPATNKAPNSPFKFKNLYTPPKMIESFKDYIARTAMKTAKIGGKRKSLYKTNKQTKKKTAKMDLIEKAAQGMAVATKIGGIKPMNFIEKADNKERTKQLAQNLAAGLGKAMAKNIKLSINGN